MPGLLGCVEHLPQPGRSVPSHKGITSKVQRSRHHPPEQVLLGAAKVVDARKRVVESTRADPMKHSAAADAGAAQLVEVEMTVLQLGEPHDLGVSGSVDLLKRNNRPGEPRFA